MNDTGSGLAVRIFGWARTWDDTAVFLWAYFAHSPRTPDPSPIHPHSPKVSFSPRLTFQRQQIGLVLIVHAALLVFEDLWKIKTLPDLFQTELDSISWVESRTSHLRPRVSYRFSLAVEQWQNLPGKFVSERPRIFHYGVSPLLPQSFLYSRTDLNIVSSDSVKPSRFCLQNPNPD